MKKEHVYAIEINFHFGVDEQGERVISSYTLYPKLHKSIHTFTVEEYKDFKKSLLDSVIMEIKEKGDQPLVTADQYTQIREHCIIQVVSIIEIEI